MDSFSPQDYSRFLLREFLKKNNYNKTYEMFMQEDTRPKVTMTKNELTRLLGIEQLMKRNSKSKTYDTMIDIICDYLVIVKEKEGGVQIAQNVQKVKKTPQKQQKIEKAQEDPKKSWFQEEEKEMELFQNKKQHKKWVDEDIQIQQPEKKDKFEVVDEFDELDDIMGMGQQQKQVNNQEVMRDTLGFLKTAEQLKKQKEEMEKMKKEVDKQKYKKLNEIKQDLNGFECKTNYDYKLTEQIPIKIQQQIQKYIREEGINQQESQAIKKLLFINPNGNFLDSWHQGIFFDPKFDYGLVQLQGGPCGILASIQAFFLKHLLFVNKIKIDQVQKDKRENCIVAAITDILINASDDSSNQICLVIPNVMPKQPIQPTQCSKIVINSLDPTIIYHIIKQNIGYFIQPEGNGAVLIVYSIILTKGIQNIINDMDMKDNTLLNDHGYVSQEMINIILIGKAHTNVFDGDRDMGDNFILKGINKQAEIGFLTLFEAYQYMTVSPFYKNPQVPIWIIQSESHYSVLFSPDFSLIKKKITAFDIIYFDQFGKQEDTIILTIKPGMYKGNNFLTNQKELIPPIDAVIRTKWELGLVNWNGRQPIL